MHPVIRIVTFLVFTLFVAFGGYAHLLFSLVVLSLFYLLVQSIPALWSSSWQMLRRMRWLFLSMLVIYLWFTPGRVVLPLLANYSPTWQGVQMAGYRIGSLIAIVVAVNIIIKSTPKELITGALLWLLTPLRVVGLPHERLAVRIVLTFNMISEIQYEYDLLKRSNSASETDGEPAQTTESGFLQRLDQLGELGAKLFTNVVEKAQQRAEQTVELPQESSPPVRQWAWPVLLAAGFLAVRLM
ncbi:MAG: energy-coupling factor transporter transmembrane protein EcfT [Gammaproteobacteria bacterium]|nr:energy-coupling factor transporter transmembrane protein EcfT [Gammaproteobacteria bacterium]